MAREGSVAPKERVNIVYRPATGDAQEEVELPLKLLVMGDFTLRPDATPVEDRAPVNVDKENFNEVLKAMDIRLKAEVPDRLSGEGKDPMSVELDFRCMQDFDPDSIAAKVPELRKLMELREALKALKGPLGNVPEFRRKLQELVEDPELRQRLTNELGIS